MLEAPVGRVGQPRRSSSWGETIMSSAARRSAPRPYSCARGATALLLVFNAAQPALADPPSGRYLGWEWGIGVLTTPTQVDEEYCSGEMIFDFAPDLTWTVTGVDEACWGRRTTTNSRSASGPCQAKAR